MRVLTTDAVATIKAAKGHYKAARVANEYGVHRSTVTRIWAGEWHRDVEPAREVPTIEPKSIPDDVVMDIRNLLLRRKSVKEVAEILGITQRTVEQHRGLFL